MTAEQLQRFRATGHARRRGRPARRSLAGVRRRPLDDDETLAIIADTYRRAGMLVDPHTAVGLGAARAAGRDPAVPMVVLATAHPAKFPDAVEQATGVRPPLPAHLADLFDRPERTTRAAERPRRGRGVRRGIAALGA